MIRKVSALIVAFLFVASVAFAAVGVQRDGTMQGTATDLNIVGAYVSSDGSTIDIAPGYPVVIATTDTITTTNSGETLIVTPVSHAGGKITLPSATVGQRYTFVDGKPTGTSTFSIDPYSTDIIRYSISSVALSAGDKLTSSGQTGDSLSLSCGATGTWYVTEINGSWTDGGA